MLAIMTKYLILNPISDIFQMPNICSLDHSHLPLYYTEYYLKDTKESKVI